MAIREWDLTRRIERINGVTTKADGEGSFMKRHTGIRSEKLNEQWFHDDVKVSVLRRMHPLVRITLVTKETSDDWRVIGVFVSEAHPTYAVFIDCNQPIHRPRICFELISTAEAMGFVGADSEYQHHLFSEIMLRIGCCVLGHTTESDFEAYGITATPESKGVGGWYNLWESYNDPDVDEPHDESVVWRGEIYGPTLVGLDFERDENERGWLLDSHAYAEPHVGHSGPYDLIDTESYDVATDLFPAEIKPMWREDRPIIYFKKTRVKHPYWIEETRCKACGQRIIISLAEAQCPKGIPATLVKCGSCKKEFQFH